MSHGTDLLGDPLPEPLPVMEMLTEWTDLIGHTVKAVIENPHGNRPAKALIITDTNCWMALDVDVDGGEADLRIVGPGFNGAPQALFNYASPQELKSAACINEEQFQHLKMLADAESQKRASRRAAELRATADLLDKGDPTAIARFA